MEALDEDEDLDDDDDDDDDVAAPVVEGRVTDPGFLVWSSQIFARNTQIKNLNVQSQNKFILSC